MRHQGSEYIRGAVDAWCSIAILAAFGLVCWWVFL
jgi:hypothetical protein